MKIIYPFPISDYYTKDQIDSFLMGITPTISGVYGIIATYQDNLWYVSGQSLSDWASATFVGTAAMTTISGDLVAQMELGGGVTQEQLTTASGDIVVQIPSLVGYATQSWVANSYVDNGQMTTISGDIIAQIGEPGGGVTFEQLTTASGDIVSQIPTDYVTHGQITTVSGDVVAQIPSLSGYATQSWANLNFIDLNEMTTISGDLLAQVGGGITVEQLTTTSGDIISQIPALVGQGGITTNLIGLTWYVDGSTISGGTAGLPTGSLNALLINSGVEWVSTTSGTPSVSSIKFTDGSEATTARSVVACSGTEVTQVFDVYYSDSFPKELFTLPANCEVTNVAITVVSGFLGGYGAEMYPTLDLITGTTNAGAATSFRRGGEYLKNGWYVNYIGVGCTNGAVIKPKYGKVWSAGTADCRDSLAITVSGGQISFTKDGGNYWQACDLFRVPDTGNYEIGVYNAITLNSFSSSSAPGLYGITQSYKTGNQTGTQITTWTVSTSYSVRLSARYAVSYKIGEELDNESIIKEFTPSVYTSVSGLQQGNIWYPTASDRLIKIYKNETVADTSGYMQVTIKYREHCFDAAQQTVISGGENIYIEQTDYNRFAVSATTPCYQSLCQRTIQASISGVSFPIGFSLLPSNHILQSMSLTLSGVVGGGGSTVGISIPDKAVSQFDNYTLVNKDVLLDNQAQISSVWLFNKTAGAQFTLKQAREVVAGTYTLGDIYSGTHNGDGEQQFDFAPVTVTGTGSDTMYISVYWSGGTETAGATIVASYRKVGNLTGYQSGFASSVSYGCWVKVGYAPSLSVGVPADQTRFIPVFTSASGTVISTGTFGPYSEVVPIEIYSTSTNISDPTSGLLDLTYSYYNPQSIQYNRGYGLPWSGDVGTEITHNFGNINHTIYITPNDINPGNWWVTKGINTDTVYSNTLSGTGTFDWFIQL